MLRFIFGLLLNLFVPLSATGESSNAEIFEKQGFREYLQQQSEFRVVVMPMNNLSLDESVAQVFRQRVRQRLQSMGYSLVDEKQLDAGLAKLGVSHAGQLQLVTMNQLRQIVNADAFMYGVVEQSATQMSILYNAYSYSCSLALLDAYGEVLWSAVQERVAKRRFALDPINALLDPLLIKKGGDATKAARVLADRMLEHLPIGPVQVQYQDPLLDQAKEINVEITN